MNEMYTIEDAIVHMLASSPSQNRDNLEQAIIKSLPVEMQAEYEDIKEGKRLPSLSSDIIAKKIFDPDEHPDRLEYLLRGITGNSDIQIKGSVGNEGFTKSSGSKKVIFDIPAKLMDGRLSDTEFQVAQQDYIFERGEIYSSEMLMIQYSVNSGEKKGDLDYSNTKGTILIMLMLHSPDKLKAFASERYIHRFTEHVSDTGLHIRSLQDIIYVQLDKCLDQYKNGIDGEDNSNLQLLLSMIADINNPLIPGCIKRSEMHMSIFNEVSELSQTKEVQIMLLAEKFAQADLNAAYSFQRREGGNKMLYDLVANNEYPIEKAAKKLNVSVEEFLKNMRLCGFNPPE